MTNEITLNDISDYFIHASEQLQVLPQTLIAIIEAYNQRGFPAKGHQLPGRWFCRYASVDNKDTTDLRGISATHLAPAVFDAHVFVKQGSPQDIINFYAECEAPPIIHVSPLTEGIEPCLQDRFSHVRSHDVVVGLLDEMPLTSNDYVLINRKLKPTWLNTFVQLKFPELNEQDQRQQYQRYEEILGAIPALRQTYATFHKGGKPVACVSAVVDKSEVAPGVGIYNLVVKGDERRKGIGRALVSSVLYDARQTGGALFAHAQTTLERNPGAAGALKAVGFQKAYPYGYWQLKS